MKSALKYLMQLTVALLLISCSSGDVPETPKPDPQKPTVTKKIPIKIGMENWTRATDASFEPGDAVGIFVVNYSGSIAGTLKTTGNHVNNMRFTYSSLWTPDEQIYWKDETTPADFYAYYPFSIVSDVTSYSFDVKSDQTTETGYKQSNFLWGKTSNVVPTENAVGITTRHLFSNAIVKLAPGSGFTQSELDAGNATVKLMNVKIQSRINLTTGVATSAGTATSIQMLDEGSQFRALVVPQTVAVGLPLISVTLNGQTYTMQASNDISFTANKQHTLTVTLNKKTNGIDIGIGEWETDEIDYGGIAQ